MRTALTIVAGSALSLVAAATAFAQTAPPAAPGAPPQQGYPPSAEGQQQPGYPPAQPGYPPPQGYPQQQPGYPPPQQPGYPPPQGYPPGQPGYPPPQGYPPGQPGYPPPQPGYPPPQGYPPPPAYQTPPQQQPAGKHGFLPIIFLGFNTFQGKTGENLSPGFRLGTILGGRLSPQFSLNGEFTLDFMNPKDSTPGVDTAELMVDLAFSPFFHIPSGNLEIVVGPKLGFMGYGYQATSGGQDAGKASASGYVYGINAGAFAALSPSVSLGGLVSFVGRSFTKFCSTEPGFAEVCSTSDLGDAAKVLSLAAGVMF